MPHAIEHVVVSSLQQKPRQQPKNKSLPREILHLTAQLLDLQDLYTQSQWSKSVSRQLHTISKSKSPITRIVSLGLGSLVANKGQSRRLKQLVVLLGIRDYLQQAQAEPVEVYAQDPTFTRLDEAFLTSLNIGILRTPSGSNLGEAASFISVATLVYSPFLTLDAYEQLFLKCGQHLQHLIGDDFDALLQKWPKRSAERKQVEEVMKQGLVGYRRKTVAGEGFWSEEDETFPMAGYSRTSVYRNGKPKARI